MLKYDHIYLATSQKHTIPCCNRLHNNLNYKLIKVFFFFF